ncbi:MAG TPA: cupin domain-containing protein [Vicinamibacterales bacterium]|nr:cupin domain-containing protein [Vicinamibacterales bacterium]
MTDRGSRTLDQVLQPFTPVQFAEMLARRAPLRFPLTDARARPLLSWQQVIELLRSGAVPPARLQVTRDGDPVPSAFYVAGGKLQLQRLLDLLDRGYSLLIRHIEQSYPPLDELASDLEALLGERVRISLVSTTGDGGALRRHFDPGDVLAIQLEGAKRWRIYDQPADHPVPAGPCVERAVDGATELDTVLLGGDRLFVPAGYWHRCENQEGRSLHISIVFNPMCVQNLVEVIAQKLADDRSCRTPAVRSIDPAARRAALQQLKASMLRRIETMSIEEMAAAFLRDDRPGAE